MSNDTIFRTLVSSSRSNDINDIDIAKQYGADDDSKYDFTILDRKSDKNLNAYFEHEVCPISLSEIGKMLIDAEEAGATHVGVFFHGDHREYEVYGYNYQLITPDELDELNQKKIKSIDNERNLSLQKLKQEAARLGVTIVE